MAGKRGKQSVQGTRASGETTEDEVIFTLGTAAVRVLAAYYAGLLLAGIGFALWAVEPSFFGSPSDAVVRRSVIGSISMAAAGSAIFYIRRLYRAAIRDRIVDPSQSPITHARFGNILYFFTRPIFGMGFAFLVYVGVRAGLLILSAQPPEPDTQFVYVIVFVSFFVGFASGSFLDRLAGWADSILDRVIR